MFDKGEDESDLSWSHSYDIQDNIITHTALLMTWQLVRECGDGEPK